MEGGPRREGIGLASVAAQQEERTSMGRGRGARLSLGDGAVEGIGRWHGRVRKESGRGKRSREKELAPEKNHEK